MKKTFAALGLSMSLLLGMAAHAQNVEKIECDISDNGVITIENELKSKKANTNVSAVIYSEGKSAADLLPETDVETIVLFSDQVATNENGIYKFEFKLGGASDTYTIEISSESSADSALYEFLYSDPDEAKTLLPALNGAESARALYDLIFDESDSWKKLGFSIALGEEADKGKVTEILYNSVQDTPLDESDPAECIERYQKAYLIELLNEGKAVSVEDAEKYSGIDEYTFKSYYNEDYITEDIKKEIFAGLSKKNIKSENEYEAALLEQIVLKTAKYSGAFGYVRDILTEYEDATGISVEGYSSSDYKRLLGKSYANYAKLETALKNKSSSGGGSGSGNTSKPPISGGEIGMTGDWSANDTLPEKIKSFDDIDGVDWAEEAIEYLARNEIINGKADGLFFPNDKILREEFVTIIVKAFDITLKADEEVEFADVKEGAWYKEYIEAAASDGIISGVGDGRFGTGENITRQDIAVILARILNDQTETDGESGFTDRDEISTYAKDAVEVMKRNNIISGFGDGSFRPKQNATRAEAAVMIYRLLTK